MHAAVESPYLGMAPAEAVYDLGHAQEGTAVYDLGHTTDNTAVYDDAGAGAVYDLGHTTENTAVYDTAGAWACDLGNSGDNSTYDLGNANGTEDDETDI